MSTADAARLQPGNDRLQRQVAVELAVAASHADARAAVVAVVGERDAWRRGFSHGT
jgi:hypothetical protein